MMKKIDKFVYFYGYICLVDNVVKKTREGLKNVFRIDNIIYGDDYIDNLINNRLFIIEYKLVRQLWKSYFIAREKFKEDNFVGFILIGSWAKGRGVIFSQDEVGRNGDIDIIIVFDKYREDFQNISRQITEIIVNQTGLKKCDFRNGENEASVIFLDKLEEYLKQGFHEKFVFLFSPFFSDFRVKKKIRKEVAKLLLNKASDEFLLKIDKRFKFNILPFYSHWPIGEKFTRNKNKIIRNLARMFNYTFQYIAPKKGKKVRLVFSKLKNLNFRKILEFYLRLEE